jgi:hypothetical protein
MKKATGIKYHLGSLGGRGRHPADPTGEFYGDSHWPLPLSHERGNKMNYMLIDVTTPETTKLLLVGTLRQVQLHGQILKADGRNVIAPPLEGRGVSRLKMEELQYMLWNTWGKAPIDAKGAALPFGELLAQCLHAAQQVLPDGTSIELLEAEVAKIAPPPEDESEHKPAAKPVKKATPRTPQKPGEAPAATSTTGKVWIIADRVLESLSDITATTDWKPIREAIIAACESEGINKATAATQYSKYKASKIANL